MLKIIKLTSLSSILLEKRTWEPVWINVNSIASFYWDKDFDYTTISFLAEGKWERVKETPEQILQLIKEAE